MANFRLKARLQDPEKVQEETQFSLKIIDKKQRSAISIQSGGG